VWAPVDVPRVEEITVFPQRVALNGWAGVVTVAVGMLNVAVVLSTSHRAPRRDGPSS